MRITILTSDLHQAGVAESAAKLTRLLQENARIHVVDYDIWPRQKPLPDGVKYSQIRAPLSAGFASTRVSAILVRLLRLPGLVWATAYMIVHRLRHKPDVVFSLTYLPNLVNVVSGLLTGQGETVVSERQDPRMDLAGRPALASVLQRAYRNASALHVNARPMVAAVMEFYGVPASHVRNVDNFFFLSDIRARAREASKHRDALDRAGRRYFVTVGRLSEQKGQWYLIKAFAAVAQQRPDCDLVIVGAGPMLDELRALAGRLGIAERVTFTGDLKNPYPLVEGAVCFIFPSLCESFGNALVEAMALSVPVIAADCPSGPGYILEKGTYGILLPPLPQLRRDPKGELETEGAEVLVAPMMALLDDPAKRARLGRLAEEGSQRFDADNARMAFLDMFSRLGS